MADRAGFDPSEVFVYRGRGSVPRNVRRVEVDRSVTFIPDRLFEKCQQLEEVRLHEGLLGIGGWAFEGCSSLRIIQIPSTVTEIGEGAFYKCSNLAAVEFPPGLESIEDYTFRGCTSLVEANIPASVARIGTGAFAGCTNLATLQLREGLRMIRNCAFDNCRSLESLGIPSSVEEIGAGAFAYCTNMRSLDLREGVRMIGDRAFEYCRSLGSLRVPSSVDEIGDGAFGDCRSLAMVQLREDLPKMKRYAFQGCTSLESFQFVRLLERSQAISMDEQTKSMFESRLTEITNALTRVPDHREAAEAIRGTLREITRALTRGGEDEDESDEEDEDVNLLWEKCKKSLERAHEFLTCLELNGSMPVLELALWKAKIEDEGEGRPRGGLADDEDGGQDARDAGTARRQGLQLSREEYRVKSGAGIVSAEVRKLFAYRASWPRLDDLE